MAHKPRTSSSRRSRSTESSVNSLRIIGGKLRGQTIRYSGDTRTRPMKERVREAIFNLIGPAIK
ncbi:MAG: RsmD family RNA methyltransferase, partial [Pirellulaceae bacterium]|nr:RsmD family RNA methyltransferase [Pirellulaceae bacterium]